MMMGPEARRGQAVRGTPDPSAKRGRLRACRCRNEDSRARPVSPLTSRYPARRFAARNPRTQNSVQKIRSYWSSRSAALEPCATPYKVSSSKMKYKGRLESYYSPVSRLCVAWPRFFLIVRNEPCSIQPFFVPSLFFSLKTRVWFYFTPSVVLPNAKRSISAVKGG